MQQLQKVRSIWFESRIDSCSAWQSIPIWSASVAEGVETMLCPGEACVPVVLANGAPCCTILQVFLHHWVSRAVVPDRCIFVRRRMHKWKITIRAWTKVERPCGCAVYSDLTPCLIKPLVPYLYSGTFAYVPCVYTYVHVLSIKQILYHRLNAYWLCH